ncbi:MAG: sortase, partial [Chloroflexaceae bacterium]
TRPAGAEPAPSPATIHPSSLRAMPLQPALHVLPYRNSGAAAAAPPPELGLAPAFSYRENSEPPEWIQAPAVGIDTPVITVYAEGLDWQEADYAAGYLYGTGDPGEPGNVVIAGHAGLRGGVFLPLSRVKIGDDIFVDTASYRFHYRVSEIKVVWPTDVYVLGANANATLTLITCTNWDTQRLIVIADLVGASRHQPGS